MRSLYPRYRIHKLCRADRRLHGGGAERLNRSEALCAYAGLVPSARSSVGKTYYGRIIHRRDRMLWWILVECTMTHVTYARDNSYIARFCARGAEEEQEQGPGDRSLQDAARHLPPAQGEEEMGAIRIRAVSAMCPMREPRSTGGASDGYVSEDSSCTSTAPRTIPPA